MTHRIRIAIVAVTVCASAVVPCFGWGHVGHMVIGEIAWQHLNDPSKAAVRDILGSETLYYASTWADRVRGIEEYDWLKPYHYVNVPKGETSYRHDLHCPTGVCVVGGIMANARILRDPTAGEDEKKQALRLLAHFVGDLHQPLHVGYAEDRGGNSIPVRFFGRKYINKSKGWRVNLHNVWDNLLIDRVASAAALGGHAVCHKPRPANPPPPSESAPAAASHPPARRPIMPACRHC